MKKVLLVYSDYYKIISKKMLLEAEKVLKKTFTVNKIRVTGSFEIPFVVSKNIKKYDGFVALGCIIQGQTPHFHFISQSINNGLIKLSIDYNKPIGNGVITCLDMTQAKKRVKKASEAANVLNLLIDDKN